MHSASLRYLAIGVLAALCGVTRAESSDKKPVSPCTIQSPKSGSFYDLRPLSVMLPDPEKKTKADAVEVKSWLSRGYDFGANFTMNICAPVVETIEKVEGLDKELWRNVSAYYQKDGKTFSLGQESSNITFRGSRMVLQYINGSPCGSSDSRKSHDKDEDLDDRAPKEAKGHRRRSTTISFHCDREQISPRAVASFVATDPDQCAYFFEVRSAYACPTVNEVQTGLGPAGVFGVIVLIAVCVYFLGGVMYQRSVAHARGWRQLPNYSLWAGIGSFFHDMFIIATSSCASLIPRRRGYLSVSADERAPARGRNGRPDDENRLIDQLDEEWDD